MRSVWPVMKLLCVLFVASAADVPRSFDCKMRKLAYAYGKKLLPRMGAFQSLYDALDLGHDCTELLQGEAPAPVPRPLPEAVLVAPGMDVQEAADRAAREKKALVLRGGTCLGARREDVYGRNSKYRNLSRSL